MGFAEFDYISQFELFSGSVNQYDADSGDFIRISAHRCCRALSRKSREYLDHA